jgi:hypothetical protein
MPTFSPPFAFVNFVAACRKNMLIPSGYFSPNDYIGWIWAPPLPAGTGTIATLQGVVDGANRVFTSPVPILSGVLVYLNGLLQDPAFAYSTAGDTITFVTAPQVGDDLMVVVNGSATGVFSLTLVPLTGTVDGVNAVFTVSQPFAQTCLILKNGVQQSTPLMYTLIGSTVTFTPLFVPQVGDILQAMIG